MRLKWFRKDKAKQSRPVENSSTKPSTPAAPIAFGIKELYKTDLALVDLGGLVCQDVLRASEISPEPHLRNIIERTYSILFLGTPHSGADLAEWAASIAKWIGLVKQLNVDTVQVLKTDSEVLARIKEDFHALLRRRIEAGNRRIDITCFYEELPLPDVGEVVPKNSAILPSYNSIGIHNNHMDMTEFRSEDDDGFTQVAGELRRCLKKLEEKRGRESFLISLQRDPHFVGRKDLIAKIKAKLEVQPRVALAGIGGVGKSQIAIEYCYQFHEKYPHGRVFWVRADTTATFEQAYIMIAQNLGISPPKDSDISVFHSVSKRLSETKLPWLMILDNADDSNVFFERGTSLAAGPPLENYIPRSPKGFIIITTRDTRVGKRLAEGNETIEVQHMLEAEAEALLQSKLPPNSATRDGDTKELLTTLENLPLAITHAAAHISECNTTLAGFTMHRLVQLATRDWLETQGKSGEYQGQAVKLLSKAFPNPEFGSWGECQSLSPHVRIVSAYGFESRESQLLHAALLYKAAWCEWEQGRYTTAHVYCKHTFDIHEKLLGKDDTETLTSLSMLAVVLMDQGEFNEAEKLCQQVLDARKKTLGKDHRATLKSMNDLGRILRRLGRYDDAEKMQRCTLKDTKRVLGKEDTDALMSMDELECQGKYQEAEETYDKVLRLYETVLGKEHSDTILHRHLAGVFRAQKNWDEAEKKYRQVWTSYLTTLGREHPYAVTTMTNFGRVKADYGKAERVHREVLHLSGKGLGERHPDTMKSMEKLAVALRKQGKPMEAEELSSHISETEKALDEEDRDGEHDDEGEEDDNEDEGDENEKSSGL
ncbi:TPR-like protein [Cenococcum geophilum 1.58]|uniref:TPR-like protein n=1 Tax=Cenococcum geophilum 1.58 TaxID=794803 RepID=UPI0035902811|nr:TPR-like protein [Cenococcum geophilum 1.58]